MTYTKLRPEHLPTFIEGNTMSVLLDDGFTCAEKGRTNIYYSPEHEDWYFICETGQHFLAGQVDEDKEGNPFFVGLFLDD